MPGGGVRGNVLEAATPLTVSIVDQLLDFMKENRLRVTDVFKMLDAEKQGRLSNPFQLTQRLYEFEIVQSLEEVKQFISDLSKVGEAASAASAFSSGTNSKARRGPGHEPSFSYDEFYKALTFRRRYRPSAEPGDKHSSDGYDSNNGGGHRPSAGDAAYAGKSVGVHRKSSPRTTKGSKSATSARSSYAQRQKQKQQLLQQKIEEKRMEVNEQQAMALAKKVKAEALRRRQLTRELAVLQLQGIEEELAKHAAQKVISTSADANAHYDHLEAQTIMRFDEEAANIRRVFDDEIAQIEAIGQGGQSPATQASRSSANTPGQTRQAAMQARQQSIGERRCVSLLHKLRDAKLKLADTAREIELARLRITRETTAKNHNNQKIRCVLSALKELLPRLGANAPRDGEVEAMMMNANPTETSGLANDNSNNNNNNNNHNNNNNNNNNNAGHSADPRAAIAATVQAASADSFKQIQERLASMEQSLPPWSQVMSLEAFVGARI